MIEKTDYGEFTECFMLLFLYTFIFHIVLYIVCKYIQTLFVCCPCMANELVLLYNTFAYWIPMTTQTIVSWDVMVCRLVGEHLHLEGTSRYNLQGQRHFGIPPKHLFPPTRLYHVTSQQTTIWITTAMTSNLIPTKICVTVANLKYA